MYMYVEQFSHLDPSQIPNSPTRHQRPNRLSGASQRPANSFIRSHMSPVSYVKNQADWLTGIESRCAKLVRTSSGCWWANGETWYSRPTIPLLTLVTMTATEEVGDWRNAEYAQSWPEYRLGGVLSSLKCRCPSVHASSWDSEAEWVR